MNEEAWISAILIPSLLLQFIGIVLLFMAKKNV